MFRKEHTSTARNTNIIKKQEEERQKLFSKIEEKEGKAEERKKQAIEGKRRNAKQTTAHKGRKGELKLFEILSNTFQIIIKTAKVDNGVNIPDLCFVFLSIRMT